MIKLVLNKGITHNHDRRDCGDCYYLQAAVSWWCKSKEAVKARKTNIPGETNCPYWKPCLTWYELSLVDRILIKLLGDASSNYMVVKENE